MGLKPNS